MTLATTLSLGSQDASKGQADHAGGDGRCKEDPEHLEVVGYGKVDVSRADEEGKLLQWAC